MAGGWGTVVAVVCWTNVAVLAELFESKEVLLLLPGSPPLFCFNFGAFLFPFSADGDGCC